MSPTMLLSFFSSVLLENDHLKINCMVYHFEFMKTIDIGNVTPYFNMIQSSSAIVYKLRLNQKWLELTASYRKSITEKAVRPYTYSGCGNRMDFTPKIGFDIE